MLFLFLALPVLSTAQSTPPVPDQYKRFFVQYSDRRSLLERALNSIGMTNLSVGRSYALIAGVSRYPNLGVVDQYLAPADIDIQKLEQYLKQEEFFDEIVVLKDGDMTLENLNFFLENYFPERLRHSPHSRFLFAYSGHGYAEGPGDTARAFLLKSSAASLKDAANGVDLKLVRTLIDSEVDAAEKTLVLINSCYSGGFIERKPFGGSLVLWGKGAHAIVASTFDQRSWGEGGAGRGSVFFEKIFDGLSGLADRFPEDGVVTYHELDAYLHAEVPLATHGAQIPMEGDISRSGSEGEFFFLNRDHQLKAGNVPPWNPNVETSFGEAGLITSAMAHRALLEGAEAFRGQNYGKAAELFRQAANGGSAEAMFFLGHLLEKGQGIAQNHGEARLLYERAAVAGLAVAMSNLGYMYDQGEGIPQDYEQARRWYEKAAAGGVAGGMYNLAGLYEQGLGVAKDYEKARQWYEKAAAASNPDAMLALGLMYDRGEGLDRDYGQARQWYEKAAASGNGFAATRIGSMYDQGLGVAQDYGQARRWYEKAATAGNLVAMNNLGFLYEHGDGLPMDFRRARQWYEKAAAGGITAAMSNLGDMYEHGRGVTKDYEKARQWYEKAAASNTDAMVSMGVMYEHGRGVPRDYEQARQWYEKAAAGGNASAMFFLSFLYRQGHGVSKDRQEEWQWLEKAAESGSSPAMFVIGVYYERGRGVTKDYHQAWLWYEKAAAAGDSDAMCSIGDLYEHGRGLTKNHQQARMWYEKAAAAGNQEAKKKLRRLPK